MTLHTTQRPPLWPKLQLPMQVTTKPVPYHTLSPAPSRSGESALSL